MVSKESMESKSLKPKWTYLLFLCLAEVCLYYLYIREIAYSFNDIYNVCKNGSPLDP